VTELPVLWAVKKMEALMMERQLLEEVVSILLLSQSNGRKRLETLEMFMSSNSQEFGKLFSTFLSSKAENTSVNVTQTSSLGRKLKSS
jgi:hypothetical protein